MAKKKVKSKPIKKGKKDSKQKTTSKSKKGKHKLSMTGLIMIGLGLIGLGTGAYFVFKPKSKASGNALTEADSTENDTTTSSSSVKTESNVTSSTVSKNAFPLKNGSHNNYVKQLQLALIKKYGKSILPRKGADGWFGGETLTALKSKNLPTSFDQKAFQSFIA